MESQMFELQWKFIRARFWFGSLPEWDYPVAAELERSYATQAGQSTSGGCAALELLIPRGGRALYGGLGAEFSADDTGNLDVRICIAQDRGQHLEGSLADRLDACYLGLIPDYTDGIFEGVVDTHAPELLGAGRLRFSRGVHGEIGSSKQLFRIMSRIVIRVLTLGDPLIEDNSILELIQREVYWNSGSKGMAWRNREHEG